MSKSKKEKLMMLIEDKMDDKIIAVDLDSAISNLELVFKKFQRKVSPEILSYVSEKSFKDYILNNVDNLTFENLENELYIELNYSNIVGIFETEPLPNLNRTIHLRDEKSENSAQSFVQSKIESLKEEKGRDISLLSSNSYGRHSKNK